MFEHTLPVLILPAALLLAAAPVAAAGPVASAASPTGAYVRLAHLSPDTPHVDVYVASVADPARSFTAKQVGYGALSDYRLVPPDTYTVSMRAAGADPDSPPVLSTTVTVRGGAAYTVAGLGRHANLGLEVLDDDLSMPATGQARLRVIQAATASSLDVAFKDGEPIATGLAFAHASSYYTVSAGARTLTAGSNGQSPAELPVSLAATGVYTVLLLDGDHRVTAQLHADALGAVVVPSGGVETGFGGTAPPGPLAMPLVAVLLGLAAAGSAGLVRLAARRRRAAPARG